MCRVLELANVTMALRRLDDDEKKIVAREGLNIIEAPLDGRINAVALISEAGLYKLLGSRSKPQAAAALPSTEDAVLAAVPMILVNNASPTESSAGGQNQQVSSCMCIRGSAPGDRQGVDGASPLR